MADLILLFVILLIVGAAVTYIRKQKKRGVTCIGWPHAEACAHKCSGCNGSCACHTDTN